MNETRYLYIGLLVDTHSWEVFRPTGRFEEAKKYFDAKNWMYALKFEIACMAAPSHYAMFSSNRKIDSNHDFDIHKKNFEVYLPCEKI